MDNATELNDQLVAIEQAGWESKVMGGAATYFRAVTAPEVVVVSPRAGRRVGDPARELLTDGPWSWFKIRDPQVALLSADCALLTYRLVARADFQSEHQAFVSSIYSQTTEGWLLAFQQQTPL